MRVRVPPGALKVSLIKQKLSLIFSCPGGGSGRHAGLKILWPERAVRVQVPPRVQNLLKMIVVVFYAVILFFATFIYKNIIKEEDENIEEEENNENGEI